jgi:hypothetical protein
MGTTAGSGATSASTAERTWRAPVGNGWPTQRSGANGVASIELYSSGRGALVLELKNLVRGAAYTVTLFKGPFVAPGTDWSGRGVGCEYVSDGPVVRLPALRSTPGGTIVWTIALSAKQMAAINAIPRKIAITVGAGRLARCGGFALQRRPVPSPTPTPSPTVAPSPIPQPACSAWPPAIADILAVLTVPDGLCLLRYPSPAEAPAFVRNIGGIYFGDPPAIYFVPGVALGSETAVLAHEVCHAHQDRVARDAGYTGLGEGWYRTAAGADYIRSTGWTREGDRWIEPSEPIASGWPDPAEDNAGLCALWFDPAFGPHFVRRWEPIRFAWAQRWLPLPSFIVPWRGGGEVPT